MATATRARRTKAKSAPEPEEIIEEELDDLDDAEEIEEEEEEPAPKKTRARRTKKPTKVNDDEDDDDLEDEEEEPKKKAGPKRQPIEFGSKWLAEFVNEKLGTEHSAYTIRALIRKMVKAGEFEREVGEDRSRYEFKGPKDPVAMQVVKFVKAEAAKPKADRSANLEKAREARLRNIEARKAAGKTNGKTKGRKKVVEEEIEDIEEMEDDDEEVDDLDD